MELNNHFSFCLVIAIRHYQTMKLTNLLPAFIYRLSERLGINDCSNENFESLVGQLFDSDLGQLKVTTNEALLIQTSLLHLIYSMQTSQDLSYIMDVSTELRSFSPRRKGIEETFQKLCYGLKINDSYRDLLLEAFDDNRALQLEELFLPIMTPACINLYRFSDYAS